MTRSAKREIRKVNWEETCSKCVHGSTKTVTGAKGKCAHKNPDTEYDANKECWVCMSFVRKWETKEDLQKARK